ncbi:MAG: DegT/DnrJ/EryC1/StrS family aminotransferase [Thermoplasmata archaeon]|nr:DegT/DnrJ/EryC1/StrS family aminotransferase [Thermoplasmata archaeon]
MIQLIRMFTDEEVVDAVSRVARSGWYINGPENKGFQEEFARFIGTTHAIAVSSGTAALHLSYRAMGLRPGDEVIMPSHTFVATAEPVVDLGGKPVFVDIDPATFTLDPDAVRSAVTRRTVGIVPVHLYGHAADMDPLIETARDNDLWILEDACQAHGAEYRGRRVGSIGDIGVFSFYPSKNMTVAGDGGMVVTSDEEVAEHISSLRDHGRVPGEKYLHSTIGYNYRLSEMHAAVGRVQLRHLADWIERRRAIAAEYSSRMEGPTLPGEAEWSRHVWHLFVIRAKERNALAAHLQEAGVATLIHYPIPVHRQPAFGLPISLPHTERIADEILSLPMHPFLTDDEVGAVVDAVNGFYG